MLELGNSLIIILLVFTPIVTIKLLKINQIGKGKCFAVRKHQEVEENLKLFYCWEINVWRSLVWKFTAQPGLFSPCVASLLWPLRFATVDELSGLMAYDVSCFRPAHSTSGLHQLLWTWRIWYGFSFPYPRNFSLS